jgi:hypothetical protein
MYGHHLLTQDKSLTELKKFIKIVTPQPFETNPQCTLLCETFQKYADVPKQLIDKLTRLLKTFNHSSEVQHTKSRLCGQLLKKGDKGNHPLTQPTNAMTASPKTTPSSAPTASTSPNTKITNSNASKSTVAAATAAMSRNGPSQAFAPPTASKWKSRYN